MKYFLSIFAFCCLISCTNKMGPKWTYAKVPTDIYYANLDLGKAQLPFIIEVNEFLSPAKSIKLTVVNGSEEIEINEFQQKGDQLIFKLPLFDNEFKGVFDGERIEGLWFNYAKGEDYVLPLKATKENPFAKLKKPKIDFSGKWKVTFSGGTDNEYPAIAEFQHQKNSISGTFLTETGDYRFLSGIVNENTITMSAFDGAHAFLFTASYQNETLKGTFYSGNHWEEPWVAVRDENITLRDANELTFIKEGYDAFEFAFPKLNGDTLSFPNEVYDDKVVIVQILGSWCPNCMDESRLYAELYDKYSDQGLEIIGLAFERPEDPLKIEALINRYKQQMDINYEILWAGKASKKVAAQKLPMLNHVMSFPTSIFIDKKGKVRKIHTGFSGPATASYQSYVDELNAFLSTLLNE